MKSSFSQLLSIFLLVLITLDSIPCKFLKENLVSLADESAIATITKDSESELLGAIKTLNKSGGTIYINTPVINLILVQHLL